MDNSLLVRGRETLGGLQRNVDGFSGGERTIPQAIAQRLAFEKFGYHIRTATLPIAGIEARRNVGVIQRSRRAGLLCEALQTVTIGRNRSGQYLDGDGATQASIFGPINLTHAAGDQRAKNLVWS